MEIVKNFSLTDRIGGSIMYENDNFSGYETGNENTTGTFSGVSAAESANGYTTYQMGGSTGNNTESKNPKKHGGYFRKAVVSVSLGLFFGLFAGIGFYAVQQGTGMLKTGTDTAVVDEVTSEAATESSQSTPQLATNVTYVESDVSDVVEKVMPAMVSIVNNFTETANVFGQLHGAGRTDAGVHARAMVASGRLNTNRTPDEIKDYLNRYLPADICALHVTVAGDRFHARLNATGKIYEYTLYVGLEKPVFDRNYVWCVPQGSVLDVDAMKKAASYLVGKHDFRSFCGNNKMKKSTVRTIYDVEIVKEGDYVRMRFHGNGFLQNMVRILTGTLVGIGYGHIDAEHMPEIIAGMDRQLAGPTAPPHGLCLLKVEYD